MVGIPASTRDLNGPRALVALDLITAAVFRTGRFLLEILCGFGTAQVAQRRGLAGIVLAHTPALGRSPKLQHVVEAGHGLRIMAVFDEIRDRDGGKNEKIVY